MSADDRLRVTLAERLPAARWWGGKGRALLDLRTAVCVTLPGGVLRAVDVTLDADAPPERWVLLGDAGDPLSEPDALARDLAGVALAGGSAAGDGGALEGEPGSGLPEEPGAAEPVGIDQSNTSWRIGDAAVLKVIRRAWPGSHPDIEVARALARARVEAVPAYLGSLALVDDGGGRADIGLLQALVPDARTAWRAAKDDARAWLGTADLDASTALAGRVGLVVADVHRGLAATLGTSAATVSDLDGWRASALADARAMAALPAARPLVEPLATALTAAFDGLEPPVVQRLHGDLHLAQALVGAGGELALIDFEGEPLRPLAERRAPGPLERDLASVLRSLDNVAREAARDDGLDGADFGPWVAAARERLLAAYAGSPDAALLRALELHKAAWEVRYAAEVLPWWGDVAVPALRDLLEEP